MSGETKVISVLENTREFLDFSEELGNNLVNFLELKVTLDIQ